MFGFRLFRVYASTASDVSLGGVFRAYRWVPGENEAVCTRSEHGSKPKHPIPVPWCECGLYSLERPDEFLRYITSTSGDYALWRGTLLVGGLIWNYGRIVVDDRGVIRAQRARVIALAAGTIAETDVLFPVTEEAEVLGQRVFVLSWQPEAISRAFFRIASQYTDEHCIVRDWNALVEYLEGVRRQYDRGCSSAALPALPTSA